MTVTFIVFAIIAAVAFAYMIASAICNTGDMGERL
jgi:hypothetical protein